MATTSLSAEGVEKVSELIIGRWEIDVAKSQDIEHGFKALDEQMKEELTKHIIEFVSGEVIFLREGGKPEHNRYNVLVDTDELFSFEISVDNESVIKILRFQDGFLIMESKHLELHSAIALKRL